MESAQTCANCGQPLDANDKFCRQCGLPTLRQAEAQKRIPTPPPDTGEFKRALDAVPEPQPFLRAEPDFEPIEEDETPEETTGSLVRATSPTQAMRMASSTLLMVGVIAVLAVAGIILIVLALKP